MFRKTSAVSGIVGSLLRLSSALAEPPQLHIDTRLSPEQGAGNHHPVDL